MNLEQIDTSTTAGKAEVMRLAAEGRRVAMRGRYDEMPWDEMKPGDEALWNWDGTDYAIISEPAGPGELFVVVSPAYTGVCLEQGEAGQIAEEKAGTVVRYIRADLAGR